MANEDTGTLIHGDDNDQLWLFWSEHGCSIEVRYRVEDRWSPDHDAGVFLTHDAAMALLKILGQRYSSVTTTTAAINEPSR